ncbi:MAG: type III-B CRISPR module-associated protein Cmr5 [Gammaproteobacteria bacterium]|nr:MAG: type III-B CRISPR module-associated protein Cmr5 [Gammaproteobacteria bacterium]
MRTLKQEYATTAFRFVEEVRDKKFKKEYLSRVKKLPSMITHNGLLTTLTFLYSKAKGDLENKADGVILRQLVEFLSDNEENVEGFIRKLAEETDFKKLLLYTKRALQLSQWLKRIAEGTLEEETSNAN